ncbi:MAG: archaeosortase H [Promethearchaeota archaeon]
MDVIIKKKIILWIILSINLILAFFIGLAIPVIETSSAILIGLVGILGLIVFNFLIMELLNREYNNSNLYEKTLIWLFLSLNLLFAFIMGFTIPFMESNAKYNMGIVMLPLLIILNYILVDRFHFYLKIANTKHNAIKTNDNGQLQITLNKKKETDGSSNKKTVIEFNGKTYIFTVRSLIILAVGAPLLSYGIYQFFDTPMNYWLHEIVVKQTVFFLNLLFNMGVESKYVPVGTHHWSFIIPGKGNIYFQTFCTGVQAICVFAGIIICIPHSQDPKTKEDIIWRKTKALIISSVIFYVVNIIRMIIQIYLYYIGYAWEDIHYSISAASSFIAAIIILLLHKWIPEFILSIIYGGALVDKRVKDNRKDYVAEMVDETNEVPLSIMRKVLGMKKKTYQTEMVPWAKKFGYIIEGDLLRIPVDGNNKFKEMLNWEEPFVSKVAEKKHKQN